MFHQVGINGGTGSARAVVAHMSPVHNFASGATRFQCAIYGARL
jgi:hypothetical protein